MRERTRLQFVFILVILCVSGLSYGSVIPLGDSGWAVTIRPTLEGRVTVFNDSTGTTTEGKTFVALELDKVFTGTQDEFGELPPIYIEFIKQNENASQMIVIRDEFITNDTSVNWDAFKMMLGSALGTPMSGFDPAYIPDGDQFASVEYQDYTGYNSLPTTLSFSNGIVPNNPADQDDFQPGWVSGSIVIVPNPNLAVGGSIVFKELPSVPEPATLGLLLAGMGLFLIKKRK